jgi:hypothetical protein
LPRLQKGRISAILDIGIRSDPWFSWAALILAGSVEFLPEISLKFLISHEIRNSRSAKRPFLFHVK